MSGRPLPLVDDDAPELDVLGMSSSLEYGGPEAELNDLEVKSDELDDDEKFV